MNKQFLEYVKYLSLRDKKTLCQKVLKTAEEVGEIARVALPYDGAYATNHRFATPEDILEEAMDTTLCCLSIAYHLGFNDDDIEEMITRKAEKWAKLQAGEDEAEFPLPFEIHVTVHPGRLLHGTVEEFKEFCEEIRVKPILLDLQNKEGSVIMTDVMTSSKHFGDNKSAYLEAQRVEHALFQRGYNVVRVKIETVPWHPAAPVERWERMPDNCYYEAHFKFCVKEEYLGTLRGQALSYLHAALYMSQNVFKQDAPEGYVYIFATHRQHEGGISMFKETVASVENDFKCAAYWIEKTHTEFAIYDTQMSHDASWILQDDGKKIGLVRNPEQDKQEGSKILSEPV